MLILSRKKNEQIMIGEGKSLVEIMIVDVKGGNVRVGIKADPEIPVHRKEVYESIQKETEKWE